MSITVQNNAANPMMQEAYNLLGQLNEHKIIVAINLLKKLVEEDVSPEKEQEELAQKRAAFARLMEIREEIAAANLPPIDEIRREAIEEKYGYMIHPTENKV